MNRHGRSRAALAGLHTLLLALLALAPPTAQAELDCIVPTRERGFDPKAPGAEAVRRAARAAAAITQRNAVFMAGDQPVRIRTTIDYSGIDDAQVQVITTAYNRKAWLAGGCKVSAGADRGGGMSDGQIAIYLNTPESLFGGQLGDRELQATGAPLPAGTYAGHPVYLAGGNAANPRVLLSRNGYRPWVLVSAGELLEWYERDLKKDEDDFAKAQQDPVGLDEAQIERIYADTKKLDPVMAEKTRASMLATLAKLRAEAPRQQAKAAAQFAKRRAAFDAYRASLTPAQRAAPGTISGATTRDGARRVDDPAGTQLARVDPAWAKRDPGRIRLVVVSIAPQPKTDPRYAWQKASQEALDYDALAALLDD